MTILFRRSASPWERRNRVRLSAPRFVLVGAGSELSLHPLARALGERGLPVNIVDLARDAAGPSAIPDGEGPIVLVTSQHLARTRLAYAPLPGEMTYQLSPQTLRACLGADALVYVPHDLLEPVLEEEIGSLLTLDLYAAATADEWWATAHVRTVNVGWVGTASWDEEQLASAPLSGGVLFLTQVDWLMSMGGGPFVLKAFEAVLQSGLAVKMPNAPGYESIYESLRTLSIPVVDPALPASGVMLNTPLVVATGLSSIVAEASLAGHRPVCVLPPESPAFFSRGLRGLDMIVTDDASFAHAREAAGRVHGAAARFDLDRFLSAVDQTLGRA